MSAPADGPLPQIRRNAVTYVTHSWLNPLLARGACKTLAQEDLPELPNCHKTLSVQDVVANFWPQIKSGQQHLSASGTAQSAKKKPRFFLTVFLHVAPIYFAHLILLCVKVAAEISIPIMTHQILHALEGKTNQLFIKNIYGLAMLFFAVQLIVIIATYTALTLNLTIIIHTNSIVTSLIYAKSLRLSNQARKKFSAGHINTLITNDVEGIANFFLNANTCITSLVQMALCLYFLTQIFGVSIWISLGAYFFLFILQFITIPPMLSGIKKYQALMDKRVKHIREFLYGIKIVKFQAAEEYLGSAILGARSSQLLALIGLIVPVVITIYIHIFQQYGIRRVIFIIQGASKGDFSASKVYTGVNFVSALVSTSENIGTSLNAIAQFWVSYRRIRDMLLADEAHSEDTTNRTSTTNDIGPSIHLKDATFVWEIKKDVQSDHDRVKETVKEMKEANKRETSVVKLQKHDADMFPAHEFDDIINVGVEDNSSVHTDEKNSDSPVDKKPSKTNSNSDKFILRDMNLSIPRGSFVAVVGSVGSGKTSLLEALVGSMRKTSGSSRLYGRVAYCTQEPWILSGTIEDNILFGRTDNATRTRLSAAVDASCLAHDLTLMPAGLGTQIGEKGVLLSGGQRARVALARALAHDADVVLLDDPLAALDAHVGHTVLDKAICGMLKSKTVVLVTHQLHVLPKTDLVVVMDGGKIVETGAFRDLMAKQDGLLTKMMRDYHIDDQKYEKEDDLDDYLPGHNTMLPSTEKSAKFRDKSVEKGSETKQPIDSMLAEDLRGNIVKWRAVKRYFTAAGGLFTFLLFGLILVNICTNTAVSVVLSSWTNNAWNWGNLKSYLVVYIFLSVFDIAVRLVHVVIIVTISYHAAQKLHDEALTNLLYAPMSFFDSQSVGHILNRMSIDVQIVDRRIFAFLSTFITNLVSLLSAMLCVIYVTPIMSLIVLAISLVSLSMFKYFQSSYRELRRLQFHLRSPLISHVSESLNGISTIQAYSVQHILNAKLYSKIDTTNTGVFILRSLQNWVGIRLQMMTLAVTLVVALMAARGMLNPSAAGLGLFAATQIAGAINTALWTYGNLEAEFNSVERIDYFAQDLPKEAKRTAITDPVPNAWPTKGAISFKNLTIRYPNRPELPVINGISVDIMPGEKVAVVGRTGSGKSTLMTALFRIVEASSGSITVDGVDIAKLGLRTLRSRLQIIPQEPVLFDGTIRSNIDLHGSHSDDEALWNALETVGLKDYVASLDGKLDAHVDEGGSNLSAGQRQLLCLCRAILAKPKVLVMDEATASVDADADRRIQAAVTSEFRNTTVLSIAHRLNTIAAYDKVVVLDAGKVVECDAPHVLLEKPGSVFGGLVDATGQANAASIRGVAAIQYASTVYN